MVGCGWGPVGDFNLTSTIICGGGMVGMGRWDGVFTVQGRTWESVRGRGDGVGG